MTTTIQIDDEIKKKLFKIKLKLEEEKGSAVTYNEIIEYLIIHQSTNIIRKKDLAEFRKLKGILPKSAMSMYLEEKRKELIREEERAPIIKKKDDS
jgi:Holliday junction resolvasome RuvABC DNA-binding subunit